MMPVTNGSKKALLFIVAGLVCLVAAGAIVASFSGKWEKGGSGVVAGPAPGAAGDAVSQEIPVEDQFRETQWVIYITGAVFRPGVYRLPEGARVYQAVEQAGGLTADADPEAFNMASLLCDGAHVHVPRKGETPPSGGTDQGIRQEGGSRLVDINSAGTTELQSLPGIGPKTAAEIIRCREEQGRFK
ncbi:MAG TPA: ComEA family DNA-binding protein, partial [Synergistetes bacterium]|nr:ComEA family DNA-binding protein [Synergistota bacterium]